MAKYSLLGVKMTFTGDAGARSDIKFRDGDYQTSAGLEWEYSADENEVTGQSLKAYKPRELTISGEFLSAGADLGTFLLPPKLDPANDCVHPLFTVTIVAPTGCPGGSVPPSPTGGWLFSEVSMDVGAGTFSAQATLADEAFVVTP